MSTENEPPVHEPVTAGDDIPFDDFESPAGRQSLSEMLRNNPMLKVGLIVGVFAVVIGGMMLFGGKKDGDAPVSIIKQKSSVNQAPGTAQVSDAYKNAVQETNQATVEKAIQTGGSALPVPIAAPVGRVPITETAAATEDPLERWRRMQEDRSRQDAQHGGNGGSGGFNGGGGSGANGSNSLTVQEQQAQAAAQAQAVKQLANAMSTQMETVLNANKISRCNMNR